jgi:hypothetical protein
MTGQKRGDGKDASPGGDRRLVIVVGRGRKCALIGVWRVVPDLVGRECNAWKDAGNWVHAVARRCNRDGGAESGYAGEDGDDGLTHVRIKLWLIVVVLCGELFN